MSCWDILNNIDEFSNILTKQKDYLLTHGYCNLNLSGNITPKIQLKLPDKDIIQY